MRPTFDQPWLLPLALALPALAAWLVVAAHRSRRRRLERLGPASLVGRLAPVSLIRRPTWRAIRLAAVALLAGVALAGPRWGAERSVVSGEGIDVVLAVDASLSMMATDEKPNRLERVKQEIRRLRAEAGGDRFALVAFAGRSYILTPLTVDESALELFLDNLDPSVVGQAGSSLASTIRQGVDLLVATRSAGDRALVIFSDGEAFDAVEDAVQEAKRAAEQGVSVVTVGVGTTQGSTIPVRDGNGMTQKRDDNGQIVVTRYHPESLRAIAQAAGGTFIDAAETDKAAKIRRALSRLRGVHRAVESGRSQRPRFQLFVAPLIALLLLDAFLAERRGRRRRAAAAASAAAAAALLLLTVIPAVPARADDFSDAMREFAAKRYARAASLFRRAIERGDTRPQTLYNYGTALLEADSLPQSADVLERATKAADPELRYRATFNLGLAHLRTGLRSKGDTSETALDGALAAYKKTLLLRPADLDAKWNYELALRKKQSGGGGGGGGQSSAGGGGGNQQQQNQPQAERPAGGIGRQQAEQLLNSASREERSVQGRQQKQSRPQPPPGGKDW